ncbi:YCF48-related protein [Psychroserpens sp.]|uniref:YCF48-related protein n=1 Tax=Psychroserpens sp. TaxID=2020870 RepID=UPI002B26DC4D|nr:YCF48-related protein [Psychroserpens sp.]
MKKHLPLIILLLSVLITQSQTNWELLNPKPTTKTSNDIAFATNNIGYIINDYELLVTSDAGLSWQVKQDISSGNDIEFYNSVGYIVGNYGYVLKSIDNGATWNQISTGFDQTIFNTISILDDNNIIISSSYSIVKSVDGGLTWESFDVPGAVVKTFFTSPLVGHAACGGGTMLKTIDGGVSWYTTMSTNTIPSNFFTVYFVNENVGFATRQHYEMFKTVDAGETWIEINIPSYEIASFQFIDDNIGFACGNDGVFIKTIDGGNTWSFSSFENSPVYDYSGLNGLHFTDINHGYATGSRGRIIKTTDGGSTWDGHSFSYDAIAQLKFIENNIGHASIRGILYKTIDGGISWVEKGAPENLYIYKYDMVNENIGYAIVGSNSSYTRVYKTIDGGVSWTQTNNGYQLINESSLFSIDFLDENIGFTSGGFNQLKTFKTINGGDSWIQVSSTNFSDIQILDSQIGFAIDNRIVYKTTDGGNNWEISSPTFDQDLTSMHFINENTGYIVGDGYLSYKTSDGGMSWQEFDCPSYYSVFVKFHSPNVGYIVAENGSVFKTMNGGVSWGNSNPSDSVYSVELISDNIFATGYFGVLIKSNIEYDPIIVTVNPVENPSNTSATITGNVTSNEGQISNVQLEYSTNFSFNDSTIVPLNSVNANESYDISVDLTNLPSNTSFYYRIKATYDSEEHLSYQEIFHTLPDYSMQMDNVNYPGATSAQFNGEITSNQNEITNVEFIYGTDFNNLNLSMSVNPDTVSGETTEYFSATPTNLEPETLYYVKLKAIHNGVEIFSNHKNFTTKPLFEFNLYNPFISGVNATLSANVRSNSLDLTDIVFEYGTLNYENSSNTTPNLVNAGTIQYVSTILTDLDPNLVYFYRLKALHGTEEIYSEENAFQISGGVMMVSGTIIESGIGGLELRGFINSNGAYLNNINFEYGLTDTFGSSIPGNPSYVSGSFTNLISATVNSIIPNTTYYYRLVADNNGTTVFSETYQYTSETLGVSQIMYDPFGIKIYPNPANNQIFIETNQPTIFESVSLVDLTGKLIFDYNNIDTTNVAKLILNDLDYGIYFLKFKYENSFFTKKLIVNK